MSVITDFDPYVGSLTNKSATVKNFLLGPPALFGYFGNQFGKVPCNIVRPVRPQYTFYKALQGFEGKYIDELTYKEKDLIKDLGIRISGKDLSCEIEPNLNHLRKDSQRVSSAGF